MKTNPKTPTYKRYVFSVSKVSLKPRMRAALFALTAFPTFAFSQEARLLGDVADGKPTAAVAPKVLPKFSVQSTATYRLKDRKIVMQRVADPGLPERPAPPSAKSKEELEALRASPEWQELVAKHKPTELVMLSATVVDGKATFLRWWHEGEEFEAWSNVDFNHFSGFAEFEAGEKHYAYMMAVGNFSSAGDRKLTWLGKPPELGVDYPAFTIVKGDTAKADALAMMVSMHDLYENEREKLVAAHDSRVREQAKQEAWLKANPPKPKDTVIQFWRREAPSRAIQQGQQKEGGR
jgi:hypothetical protein